MKWEITLHSSFVERLFRAGTEVTKKAQPAECIKGIQEGTQKCLCVGIWPELGRKKAKDGISLEESSWASAQALFLHPKPHQQLRKTEIIPVDKKLEKEHLS